MKDYMIALIAIIITFFLGVHFLFGNQSIEAKIANQKDQFQFKRRVANDVKIYNSKSNIKETLDEITDLEQPYDTAVKKGKKSVLLYPDNVVCLIPVSKNKTKVEVADHDDAYRRHHNIIVSHWGGRMKNGSIGNPPARSGGFGFGK